MVSTYYLTHIGGLEDIVASEVAERLPSARVVGQQFGRLYLEYDGNPRDLLDLRTIENACLLLKRFDDVRPDAGWVDDLELAVAAIDLQQPLEVLRRQRPISQRPSFRVTAERSGPHDFRSPQIAGAAGAGIGAATGWPVDLENYEVEIRVEVRGAQALVGMRLSGQPLHKRSRLIHPRITLNATVAAALVRLSEPQAGEVVCDPMMGAGTILTERHSHAAEALLLGGELYAEKLAVAAHNFEGLQVPVHLVQWDARRLPLLDETVDKFICNPPWGNLVSDRSRNRQLYPWFLGHLWRCLKPGGRIVLLTRERALVQSFVAKHADLRLVRQNRLSLGNLHPTLHLIDKD